MRIGLGTDIHKLVSGKPLILGGVNIPYELGIEAHSDGDVIYHALSDAILGALALGDIGLYFPDNLISTKDINSAEILKFAFDKICDYSYKICNIDICVTLEKPKLRDYVDLMRCNIAKILHCEINQISIKCGTNEGLDSIGENKAIKVDAIVLLEKGK